MQATRVYKRNAKEVPRCLFKALPSCYAVVSVKNTYCFVQIEGACVANEHGVFQLKWRNIQQFVPGLYQRSTNVEYQLVLLSWSCAVDQEIYMRNDRSSIRLPYMIGWSLWRLRKLDEYAFIRNVRGNVRDAEKKLHNCASKQRSQKHKEKSWLGVTREAHCEELKNSHVIISQRDDILSA